MPEHPLPHQPPPRDPTPRWCLAVGTLGMAALLLGAVIAHQRAESAHAHPLPPPGHHHPTPTTTRPPICSPPNACYPPPTTTRRPPPTTTARPPTTTRPPICSPPNACYPPPTTTRRPPPTTTARPTISFPPCFPRCGQPPPTTTARPVATTTQPPPPTTTRRPPPTTTTRRPTPTTTARPTISFPPCFPRCGQPPPTTTQPPPPTTTTAPPRDDCGYSNSWACDDVTEGIENGYLPEDFDLDAHTTSVDLRQIVDSYGEHNPGFDTEAALDTLPDEGLADRGDMFIAIAIGIGLDVDPDDDPFEVADELADMGILQGHDGDNDGVTNPYSRPDADPDSTMTNAQLAAFLNRIEIPDDPGSGGPAINRPEPGRPGGGEPGPPDEGGTGPGDEMCTTGLRLSNRERTGLAAQLRWATLVGVKSEGEPGRPWPPHPDVPGGTTYLVVAGSPVWPVADPAGAWHVPRDDGCLWQVVSIQTRLTQLRPWRPSDRSTIENADEARPGSGFGVYLSRWDNLSAAQQAQAQQHHRNGDLSKSCGVAAAMVSDDSYDQCRWELPTPGVWSWQARACFEGVAEDTIFRQCAILARGVEWFLDVIDYTSGTTLHHHSGAAAHHGPRRPARTG